MVMFVSGKPFQPILLCPVVGYEEKEVWICSQNGKFFIFLFKKLKTFDPGVKNHFFLSSNLNVKVS